MAREGGWAVGFEFWALGSATSSIVLDRPTSSQTVFDRLRPSVSESSNHPPISTNEKRDGKSAQDQRDDRVAPRRHRGPMHRE